MTGKKSFIEFFFNSLELYQNVYHQELVFQRLDAKYYSKYLIHTTHAGTYELFLVDEHAHKAT